MLIILLLLLAVGGGACVPSNKEMLMDEIERSVVLPKGALPFESYGRNYASSGLHRVTAIYYATPASLPDAQCSVYEKSGFRPCTKEEITENKASIAREAAAQAPAGQRRWFSIFYELPTVYDGGCSVVTIEFDTAAHRVVASKCNGPHPAISSIR